MTLVFFLIISFREQQTVAVLQRRKHLDQYINFLLALETNGDTALALANTLARQTEIQKAFQKQDRLELTRLVMPTYIALDSQLNIQQCQFHLPGAISLLRLHNLDAYGDNLSHIRQAVVDAQDQRVSIDGLELGQDGLSMRGVTPVWDGSDFIGTLEFGIPIDTVFLNEYLNENQLDISIYLFTSEKVNSSVQDEELDSITINDDIWLYASTLQNHLPVQMAILDKVRESNSTEIIQLKHGREYYSAVVGPLFDYSEKMIGLVQISEPYSPIVYAKKRSLFFSLFATVLVMGSVSGISYSITRRMLQPVKLISHDAQRAANGDLKQQYKYSANYEIGELATSFNTMMGSLNQTLSRITNTVDHLSASGISLGSEIEQMHISVDQISTTTQEMALGAGTQARRIEEVSESMKKFAAGTGSIAINAHSTGETTTSSLQMVDEVKNYIAILADKADRIESIVTNVDKIARKTNMVAINASIEAVKAGDYGSGFAVVAGEIRRLAETSSQLVGEIAELNQDIGEHLENIKVKINNTQQAVMHNAILAQKTAITTREQENASDAMVDAINEIAVVAEENAVSSDQIASTIEDQVGSLENINEQVQVLVELLTSLQDIVAHLNTS
jgi:methyl-accepting chemotaxis protein